MPTPLATDVAHRRRVEEQRASGAMTRGRAPDGQTYSNGLTDWLLFHSLPTPVAQDWRRRGPNSAQKGLPEVFHELMHTPVADGLKKRERDGQKRMNREDFERLFPGMSRGSTDGTPSRLNPLFVQEMMGFPSGWLTSPFLSDGGGRRR